MDTTAERQLVVERQAGVGGSDAAAVFNLDPYKSRLQLWREKTGLVPPTWVENYHMRRGRRQETIAAQLVREQFGGRIEEVREVQRHRHYPWMIGHLDRLFEGTLLDDLGPGLWPVELKAPSLGVFRRIQRHGIPVPHLYQLMHYLVVMDKPVGLYGAFSAELDELFTLIVRRDPALSERLVEGEREFWACVENGIEPGEEAPGTPPLAEAPFEPVADLPEEHRDDPAFVAALAAYRDVRSLREGLEEAEAEAKARLLDVLGHYGVYHGPAARLYYRQMPGRITFDRKALTNAQPLDRIATLSVLNEHGVRDDVLKAVVEQGALDLARFEKQGKSYTELRPYFFGEGA